MTRMMLRYYGVVLNGASHVYSVEWLNIKREGAGYAYDGVVGQRRRNKRRMPSVSVRNDNGMFRVRLGSDCTTHDRETQAVDTNRRGRATGRWPKKATQVCRKCIW